MKRSNEVFLWSLFSAGGVVAALFIPAFIFVTGIVSALGWQPAQQAFSHDGVQQLLGPGIVRVVVGVVVALPLIHAAHRIRHLIIDLHAPVPDLVLAPACYGAALAGTAR